MEDVSNTIAVLGMVKRTELYAYLGEADEKIAREIMSAFPYVAILDFYKVENTTWYELGVPKTLGEEAVGMYQMLVQLWGEKELQKKVGDLLM